MRRFGKYYARRNNNYVPAMGYSADVVHNAPHRVNFGAVALANTTLIVATSPDINAAGSSTTFVNDNTDPVVAATAVEFPYGPGFGRCLQLVCSGTSTAVVTVNGTDYLGQPMTESFTLTGITPVIGVKAFKYLTSYSWTASGASRTISIGTTDKLGLPFRMTQVLGETLDGVNVATLGTLVTPNLTDPQTATTTDPRGTYDPQSTLNGTAYLSAIFMPNGNLNASGNGGLHGLAHYRA